MTVLHPHCGRCSQCLDRRFGILGAAQAQEDPEEGYEVDLFRGDRGLGPDREMALAYVRSASRIKEMTDISFFSHYGETSRVVGFFSESTDTVAGRIFDLHKRHAATVCEVFDDGIRAHAAMLREGSLPATCLLSLGTSKHGKDLAHPKTDTTANEVQRAGQPLRIALDPDHRRVLIDRWGVLTGQSAFLVNALGISFRRAMQEEKSPEHYPFISSSELVRETKSGSEETLRRRVLRCRNTIASLAESADANPPSLDAVIENSQWHGYRLNPDSVRIVAVSELTERAIGHASRPKGHASRQGPRNARR